MGRARGAAWLATVWLSPAAALAAWDALLADGTRGLAVPLALGAGAALAALGLGVPWARGPGELTALIRRRWPECGPGVGFFRLLGGAGAGLFLWAQLAAWREACEAAGWRAGFVTAGLAILVGAAALRPGLAAGLAGLAAALAVAGGGLALGVAMLASDPVPVRPWRAVGSRSALTFAPTSAWTTTGGPIMGPEPEVRLRALERQSVVALADGRLRVELWDGGRLDREVRGGAVVVLDPGDQLVAPRGFPLRFEPGRRIPGAPDTGPAWLDPASPSPTGWGLAGWALSLTAGALGLAPVHRLLVTGHAVAPGALLAVAGAGGTALWALYVVWLVPEVYAGGVLSAEGLQLPAAALPPAWRAAGGTLARVAFGAGVLAAAWAALEALDAPGRGAPPRRTLLLRGGVLAAATGLTLASSARAATVLLHALGLAAVAAPAAVLVGWRERLSPRAVTLGALAGTLAFVVLVLARPAGRPGMLAAPLAAWPALGAVPVAALATWVLSWLEPAPRRGPLPRDLAALHAPDD